MMDEVPSRPGSSAPDLRAAMRKARMDEAERSEAVAEVRGAELARLELLRDAIEPVLAQIPDEVEMFDSGVMPGPTPRLFIDMIAFVEMGHDKRLYRFVQDNRHGRVVLAQTDDLDIMTDAVTAYVARRLVEREKALATTPCSEPRSALRAAEARTGKRLNRAAAGGRRRGWVRDVCQIILEYLGILALCLLVLVLLRYAYDYRHLLLRR